MENLFYLGNKTWSEITREERYFCAELFFDIQFNPKSFIFFLNHRFHTNYDAKQFWEVGFEVCFYRDYFYSKQKKVRLTEYSEKRTFDLCLFSNTHIIIIEAKADQKFNDKQLSDLKSDVKDVQAILDNEYPKIQVMSYLLNSSKREKEITGFAKFTWEDLYNSFKSNPVFLTADNLPLREKPYNV